MNQHTHAVVSSPAQRGKSAGAVGMVVVFAAGLLLAACNTTAGAGADVSAVGHDVTKAATATKNAL